MFVTGGAIYALREDIRDNVADEVSTVATRSLSDENVQQKAQQLSKALLQELLNDETIRVHAGKDHCTSKYPCPRHHLMTAKWSKPGNEEMT